MSNESSAAQYEQAIRLLEVALDKAGKLQDEQFAYMLKVAIAHATELQLLLLDRSKANKMN